MIRGTCAPVLKLTDSSGMFPQINMEVSITVRRSTYINSLTLCAVTSELLLQRGRTPYDRVRHYHNQEMGLKPVQILAPHFVTFINYQEQRWLEA